MNNNQEEELIKSINERNQNLLKDNSQKSYEEFKYHQEGSVVHNENKEIDDVNDVENKGSKNIVQSLWSKKTRKYSMIFGILIFASLVLGLFSDWQWVFLWINALFAMLFSYQISEDIKKINSSKKSKIVSIIFITLILFSIISLSQFIFKIQGILHIGKTIALAEFALSILAGLSLIASIKNILKNNEKSILYKLNNAILILLFIIINMPLFWNMIIRDIAYSTNSSSVCHLGIGIFEKSVIFNYSTEARDLCIYRSNIKTSKYCASLKSGNLASEMDNCYFAAAQYQHDKDICYEIETADSRNDCFMYAAHGGDYSSCDDIIARDDNDDRKNYCYLVAAKARSNVDICDYIDSDKGRESCYESVSAGKEY